MDSAMEDKLRTGTRFWLAGGTPSLSDLSSLKSVIAGPGIAMMPGPGKPARHFTLYDNARDAQEGPIGPRLSYLVQFTGAVGALKIGGPVKLRGFTVGRVIGFSLDFDARTATLSTPVTIGLEPRRFTIAGQTPPADGDPRATMNAMLERLIQKGLRAQLSQDPPLIGSETVTLAVVPGAPDAHLVLAGPVPQIPSAESRGIGDLMTKLGKVPLDQISANVLQITAHLRDLTASPQIRQSIAHLDNALAGIDKAVSEAGPQIGPLVSRLRRTARELQSTAHAADKVLGGNAASQNGLNTTLREIERAARAVRSLADYLDRHPEALIKGR
jgi:paraquat-inducible protein B